MNDMPAIMHQGHDHDAHMAMDHGHDHMDHSHGPSATPCKMNMIWNYDTDGLCLVFPSWQITSTASLYTSLVAIVLLGVGYEWLRLALKRLDRHLGAQRRAGGGRRAAGKRRARDAARDGDSLLSHDGDDPHAKSQAALDAQKLSVGQLFRL